MLEFLIIGAIGLSGGWVLGKAYYWERDRRKQALQGESRASLEKRLKAAEKESDDMRSYLGLSPMRRAALDDEASPAAEVRPKESPKLWRGSKQELAESYSKLKARTKNAQTPDPPVISFPGAGVGMPIFMLGILATVITAEQQKKKAAAKKARDLKDEAFKNELSDHIKDSHEKVVAISARLKKQAAGLISDIEEHSGFAEDIIADIEEQSEFEE